MKVVYLDNLIADQQNILGHYQQWINSFWVEFSFTVRAMVWGRLYKNKDDSSWKQHKYSPGLLEHCELPWCRDQSSALRPPSIMSSPVLGNNIALFVL
jgi:hypothetical protein